ncbi:ABC-2 type transport system permease protein [Clostridium tetanomorphum]|uniref:ABC transporter permease n=1 Tax=Clostridium tetanomorphum TaxID=1553 RepID=UPI0004451E3F|nr:ABC transporter permease [Clostridium tetanomorphum]KAJ53030.1 hypothetical protein CTM_05233 [Clostridium tetanomorphum DSM 665]MBP1864973.1 ABC-2 type transport system permease protein [Clostridium tetanomorphum]NRS83179.1 ABC-2 type transport system permease protein [Clostridium tetanomorphum]SQC01227.1 bacitracin ABC transporter permease protein BcrB [Clostridium tetanomorphum]
MLNYIKAELYRNFNRLYFWGYTGGICIFILAINIIIKTTSIGNDVNLTVLFQAATFMLGIPVFLIVAMVDMCIAEEERNVTLKNVVSFGFERNKLVLSKIIATIILSIISAIIILTMFFGSAMILLPIGDKFSTDIIINFTKRLSGSMVLWIAAISVCSFLAFVIKSNTMFSLIYAMTFLFFKKIVLILSNLVSDKFKYIYDILITTQLDVLAKEELTNSNLSYAILIGVIYIIVFTILTMVYVKNKEIK